MTIYVNATEFCEHDTIFYDHYKKEHDGLFCTSLFCEHENKLGQYALFKYKISIETTLHDTIHPKY